LTGHVYHTFDMLDMTALWAWRGCHLFVLAACRQAGDEAAAAAQQAALEAAALSLHEEQQPKYWTDFLQVMLSVLPAHGGNISRRSGSSGYWADCDSAAHVFSGTRPQLTTWKWLGHERKRLLQRWYCKSLSKVHSPCT
jgi:hypothetical protein